MDTYVGQVIRIIDQFTIIVNAGSGVLSVGQTVQVYETGDTIKDLNGNELSPFYHIKDELDVIQVENTYSVCKKNKMVTKIANTIFSVSPLLQQSVYEKIPLSVNPEDIHPIGNFDSKIHLGDFVKLA